MSKLAQKTGTWISALAASKRLGKSIYVVMKLAAQGEIATKADPGTSTKYNSGDVDRLAREYAYAHHAQRVRRENVR